MHGIVKKNLPCLVLTVSVPPTPFTRPSSPRAPAAAGSVLLCHQRAGRRWVGCVRALKWAWSSNSNNNPHILQHYPDSKVALPSFITSTSSVAHPVQDCILDPVHPRHPSPVTAAHYYAEYPLSSLFYSTPQHPEHPGTLAQSRKLGTKSQ